VAAEAGAGVGQLVLGPGDGLLGVPLIARCSAIRELRLSIRTRL
jgi:hypothetical protein